MSVGGGTMSPCPLSRRALRWSAVRPSWQRCVDRSRGCATASPQPCSSRARRVSASHGCCGSTPPRSHRPPTCTWGGASTSALRARRTVPSPESSARSCCAWVSTGCESRWVWVSRLSACCSPSSSIPRPTAIAPAPSVCATPSPHSSKRLPNVPLRCSWSKTCTGRTSPLSPSSPSCCGPSAAAASCCSSPVAPTTCAVAMP